VFDIDSSRVLYTISRWSCMNGQTDCAPKPPSIAKGILLSIGKAAVAFEDAGVTTIAGFGTDGKRRVYDSGPWDQLPFASLRRNGEVATWLHSGQQRSGPLP
jgi:hypothetical protein